MKARLDDETRTARVRRLWHLHVTGQWRDWLVIGTSIMALFLIFWMFGHGVKRFGAWFSELPGLAALKPSTRALLSGMTFAGIGGGMIATRVRRLRRQHSIESLWDHRTFILGIVLILSGVLQILQR